MGSGEINETFTVPASLMDTVAALPNVDLHISNYVTSLILYMNEERDIFEINPYDLIEDNPLSSEVKTEDETFNIDLDNDKKELLNADNETINDSISDNLNENYKSLIN